MINDLTTALQCAFENLYEALTGDYGPKEKMKRFASSRKGGE